MKVTIQNFNVEVDIENGKRGIFAIHNVHAIKERSLNCYMEEPDVKDTLIGTFGFKENGEILNRREEKDGVPFATIKQEWIDRQIKEAIEEYIKHENDHDREIEEMYVAVIKRSDIPNQIGITCSLKPQSITEFSIKVEEEQEVREI